MRTSLKSLEAALVETCAAIPRRVQVMEVCGTHTVSFFRSGLRAILPENLRLVSGPGCPVCVTAQRHIDAAIELAGRPGVLLATYGDMLRVPGQRGSLEAQRARGAAVVVVNSARRALVLAVEQPDRQVVFLAVGFETTAPATAAVVVDAARRHLANFSVLTCHKLVVPAMSALLSAGDARIDGFLCPGHVSVIIGAEAYRPIVSRFGKPCVVAGFEPRQMVDGLLHLVRQIRAGRTALENVYGAVVGPRGNSVALALLRRVFEPAATAWRALGEIGASGLELRPEFSRFDAMRRFDVRLGADADPPGCRCGEVIAGRCEPMECALFGRTCTPMRPVGPCMVSSEGTCAAWFKYGGARPREAAASVGP